MSVRHNPEWLTGPTSEDLPRAVGGRGAPLVGSAADLYGGDDEVGGEVPADSLEHFFELIEDRVCREMFREIFQKPVPSGPARRRLVPSDERYPEWTDGVDSQRTIVCNHRTIRENGVCVVGNQNRVCGDKCIVSGNRNTIAGYGVLAVGDQNIFLGSASNVMIIGDENVTSVHLPRFIIGTLNELGATPIYIGSGWSRNSRGASRRRRREQEARSRDDSDRVVRARRELSTAERAARAIDQLPPHEERRRRRVQMSRADFDNISSNELIQRVSQQFQRPGLARTRPIPNQGGLNVRHEQRLRRQARERERRQIDANVRATAPALQGGPGGEALAALLGVSSVSHFVQAVVSSGNRARAYDSRGEALGVSFGVAPVPQFAQEPVTLLPSGNRPRAFGSLGVPTSMPGLDKFGSIKDVVAKEGESTCVVCMDHKVRAVMAPCGHMCTCRACAEELHARSVAESEAMRCPMCREQVVAVTPLREI